MDERTQLLAIFGLPASASLAQAKAAYRAKVRQHHPDQVGGDHGALVRFNLAWDRLQALFRPQAAPARPQPAPTRPQSATTPAPDRERAFPLTQQDLPARMLREAADIVSTMFTQANTAMQHAPRKARWTGQYGADAYVQARVQVASSLVRNSQGLWGFLFPMPLKPGQNILIHPIVRTATNTGVTLGHITHKTITSEHGDSGIHIDSTPTLGPTFFSFEHGHGHAFDIDSTDPGLMDTLASFVPSKQLLLHQDLLKGTAPTWARRFLRTALA